MSTEEQIPSQCCKQCFETDAFKGEHRSKIFGENITAKHNKLLDDGDL